MERDRVLVLAGQVWLRIGFPVLRDLEGKSEEDEEKGERVDADAVVNKILIVAKVVHISLENFPAQCLQADFLSAQLFAFFSSPSLPFAGKREQRGYIREFQSSFNFTN